MQFTTYHIVKNFKRLILRSMEKTNLEQLSSGFVVEVRFVSIFAEWSKSWGSMVESVSSGGNDINE